MANSVVESCLRHVRMIPHFYLGISEYHGSLRQQRQCDLIIHVAWRVATRHECSDSHRSSQHSTIVGLVHRSSCKLNPSTTLTPLCLEYKGLGMRHDIDAQSLSQRLPPDYNHTASPKKRDERHGLFDWFRWCFGCKLEGTRLVSISHSWLVEGRHKRIPNERLH